MKTFAGEALIGIVYLIFIFARYADVIPKKTFHERKIKQERVKIMGIVFAS